MNVLTAAVLNTGNLNLATAGGTTTSATLNIHGTDSRLTQSAAATLTVGHASEGTATINVGTTTTGGHLTTGSGLFRINKTGTVTIGNGANGGTLEVVGNIIVDGGVLQEGSDQQHLRLGHRQDAHRPERRPRPFRQLVPHRRQLATCCHRRELAARSRRSDSAARGGSDRRQRRRRDLRGATPRRRWWHGGQSRRRRRRLPGHRERHENLWGTGGAATVTLSNQASATLAGSLSLAGSANTLVNVISGADLTSGDLSLAAIGGTPVGHAQRLGSRLHRHAYARRAIWWSDTPRVARPRSILKTAARSPSAPAAPPPSTRPARSTSTSGTADLRALIDRRRRDQRQRR